jgi:hypothetical protein
MTRRLKDFKDLGSICWKDLNVQDTNITISSSMSQAGGNYAFLEALFHGICILRGQEWFLKKLDDLIWEPLFTAAEVQEPDDAAAEIVVNVSNLVYLRILDELKFACFDYRDRWKGLYYDEINESQVTDNFPFLEVLLLVERVLPKYGIYVDLIVLSEVSGGGFKFDKTESVRYENCAWKEGWHGWTGMDGDKTVPSSCPEYQLSNFSPVIVLRYLRESTDVESSGIGYYKYCPPNYDELLLYLRNVQQLEKKRVAIVKAMFKNAQKVLERQPDDSLLLYDADSAHEQYWEEVQHYLHLMKVVSTEGCGDCFFVALLFGISFIKGIDWLWGKFCENETISCNKELSTKQFLDVKFSNGAYYLSACDEIVSLLRFELYQAILQMQDRIVARVCDHNVDPFLFPVGSSEASLNTMEYAYVQDQIGSVESFRGVGPESPLYRDDRRKFFDELFDPSRDGNVNFKTITAEVNTRKKTTPAIRINVGSPKIGSQKSVYLAQYHTSLLVERVLPKYGIFVNLKVLSICSETARYKHNDNHEGFGDVLPTDEILDVPLRYESVRSGIETIGHWTPLEPLRCHRFHDAAYCESLEQTILADFDAATKRGTAEQPTTKSPKKKKHKSS